MSKSKKTKAKSGPGYGMPDAESPELSRKDIRGMRPAREVMPDLAGAMKAARGRPRKETPLAQVSLRVDPDVLEAFKAQGEGWQGKMREALKTAAKALPRKRKVA